MSCGCLIPISIFVHGYRHWVNCSLTLTATKWMLPSSAAPLLPLKHVVKLEMLLELRVRHARADVRGVIVKRGAQEDCQLSVEARQGSPRSLV
jgi:hypothetical protein